MVSPGRIRRSGEMVERFKASVLKTDEGQPSGGSNPPLSAILESAATGGFQLRFMNLIIPERKNHV